MNLHVKILLKVAKSHELREVRKKFGAASAEYREAVNAIQTANLRN